MIKQSLLKNAAWLAVAVALPFVAGCGKQAGHALPEPPRVALCDPGQPGGRLVLASEGIPKTFNPLLATDGASDSIARLLFSSLVHYDMIAQEPRPGLAESWSVDADQRTWTFKLRKGLRWSDGQPLTAEDVVFTWNEAIYNPDINQFTRDLFRVDGKPYAVTNVDDLTVRIVTPDVVAPFLEYVSGAPVLPKHILARAVRAKTFLNAYAVNSNPEQVVGSGPFRLKDVRASKLIVLERNVEYYAVDKRGQRLPYLDELQINVAPDPGMAPFYFFQNQSDVCESVRPDARQQFEQAFTKRGGRLVELGAGAECNYVWFNQNTNANGAGKPLVAPSKLKWFREKKFRQAVSCAVDRDRMVREIYGGRAQPAYSFNATDNPKWNNPNVPRFAYDPARARALLAEMGIQDRNGDGVLKDGDGNVIEFSIHSNAENASRSKMAAMIAEDLKKIGIKAEYHPTTFQTMIEKINTTYDYEGAVIGLGGGGVDPAAHMNVLKSGEALHQWFPQQKMPSTDWEAKIDSLMDAQMRTLEVAARKKYFDEVQAIWAEQQPMIAVAAPLIDSAIRPDLANVRPAVASQYHATWNIEELYLQRK